MTFKQYLDGRMPSNGALGTFTKMAITDDPMPDAREWIGLRFHLERRGTSPEQIKAAKVLWRTYQARMVAIGADRG